MQTYENVSFFIGSLLFVLTPWENMASASVINIETGYRHVRGQMCLLSVCFCFW